MTQINTPKFVVSHLGKTSHIGTNTNLYPLAGDDRRLTYSNGCANLGGFGDRRVLQGFSQKKTHTHTFFWMQHFWLSCLQSSFFTYNSHFKPFYSQLVLVCLKF